MKKFDYFKHLKLLILFFVFTFLQKINSQNFVHPDVMQKKVDLDFIKSKIQVNEQLWKNAYDKFLMQKADNYQGIYRNPIPR